MNKNRVKRIVFASKPNMWRHNVYTITKENCEKYLEMYRVIYGLETTILRPFNVYGPEEKVEQYRKAVPYFMISALKNEPIQIFGGGEQTMDLIHVRDCVEAFIVSADERKAVGEVIEIGSGTETIVNELAQLIIKLAGSKSKIKHVSMRKGETPDSRIKADTRNMEDILQLTPRVTLEEGLSETIEHYRNHLHEYTVYEFSDSELCSI
jgi:UDP-glucose 4-epimerase